MNLADRFTECVRASCSALWIKSENFVDTETTLLNVCQQRVAAGKPNWDLGFWDAHAGLIWATKGENGASLGSSPGPLGAALDALGRLGHTLRGDEGATILVLKNPQPDLRHAGFVAQLANLVTRGRTEKLVVAVLTAGRINEANLPSELARQFITIKHELPDEAALWDVAQAVAGEEVLAKFTKPQRQHLIEASLGLTHLEAELAYALSLVRHERLEPDTVWETKTQLLETAAALELYSGKETFSDLLGLGGLKAYCLQLINSPAKSSTLRPLGVLLVGPAGTGKSAFCKALGNEVGRKTIAMAVSKLRNKFQGESEARTARALEIVDAMGTSILFIDELEKAFGGSESSGATDGGTGMRLLGTWLSWMNDRTSDTFIVASANEVQDLPSAFTRAERFDAIFFVDLPSEEEREAIWTYYLKAYQVDAPKPSARMLLLQLSQNWTGAEIKACCRQAKLRDIPMTSAVQAIVPVAVKDGERLAALRAWANERCLSASTGEVYRAAEEGRKGGGGSSRRRAVSNN